MNWHDLIRGADTHRKGALKPATLEHQKRIKPLVFLLFAAFFLVTITQSGCVALTGPAPTNKAASTSSKSKADPATPELTATSSSLSFGSVNVGSNSTLDVTLTNSGNADVTISNVTLAGPGFDVSGVPTGLILAPAGTATLAVSFTPAATGSVTGSVAVSSDDANSPVTIALSGSGTQSVSHSVALSWTPNASAVTGYNVYRSVSSSGPYAKLNSSPNADTAFTDSTVQAGQIYYYTVTAVASDGNTESSYSSPVSATIPTS
jgi:HYDIN/CFA65/VesB-like, Ig-like domain